MKINDIQQKIYDLVESVTDFNQGFNDRPKDLPDEKLPAFAVYYVGHDNDIATSLRNKRRYLFQIDVIYDKEDLSETQEATSDLVSTVIDILESQQNHTLEGEAAYTEPTTCQREQDYQIAGKHYRAYSITLPVITIE